MHDNYRNDLPLLCKAESSTRWGPLRKETKVVWRYEYQRFHSERVVKPWGRVAKTHIRQWEAEDRTFIHLACGINHKVNAWL